MPAPTPPTPIDAVPPTPDRNEGEVIFVPKMYTFLDYFAPFRAYLQSVVTYCADAITWVAGLATAAAASATASEASRQAADAAQVDAEAAAAAAQLAAGFPTDPNFGSVFRSEGVENLKTANFAAVVGRVYDCDTSAGAFTVTLPASLSIGDWIGLRDISGTWALNNITVNRNGHNIFGVAENEILDMNQSTVFLEYRGVTMGVIY